MDTLKKKLIISIIAASTIGCGGSSESGDNDSQSGIDALDGDSFVIDNNTGSGSSSDEIDESNFVSVASGIYTKTILEANLINLQASSFKTAIRLTKEPETTEKACQTSGTRHIISEVDTTSDYILAIGDKQTDIYKDCVNGSGITTQGETVKSVIDIKDNEDSSSTVSISYQNDYYQTGKSKNEENGQYNSKLDVVLGNYYDINSTYSAINPYVFYASKTPDFGFSEDSALEQITETVTTPPPESGLHHETPVYQYATYAFEMIVEDGETDLGFETEKTRLQWLVDANSKHNDYYSYYTETIKPLVLFEEEILDADDDLIDISIAESGEFYIKFSTGQTIHFEAFDPTGSEVGATLPEGHTVVVSLDKDSDGDYEVTKSMSWTSFGFGGLF